MVRQHRTTAAVVISLALTASLAPTASADPAPLARAEAVITATHGSALVRPNPDEQAAPSTPSVAEASCGDVCSGHGYGNVDVVPLSPSVRPTSTAADNGGFDWGDAGAGAGAVARPARNRTHRRSRCDKQPQTARPRTARDRNQLSASQPIHASWP